MEQSQRGRQTRIYPYSGIFGSGNNMAFSADALRHLGPFDEALGAGSPAAGGEDLDMFIRLVLAGRVLVYEPDAVVLHTHRLTPEGLAAQIRAYGSGLSAMITKQLVSDPAGRRRILRRALPGLRHLLSTSSAKNSRKRADYPLRLTWLELRGVLEGPWLYLRSRRGLRDDPTIAAASSTGGTSR
jgi:cellulose synthase/poly-beta-1,6-N-acetylglucosamine synthase-like glycosyltransferase